MSNKVTPYDTGKVKIGIYYEPKVNYYNPDQDWVQKAILGIETFHVVDTVMTMCLQKASDKEVKHDSD